MFVEGKLKDTVALITGADSGIGAATARRLAAEGAAVALVARRRDRLDELASAICRDGGIALVVQADVTRQTEARGAVERTVAQLGRLDIVVNNAHNMLLGSAVDTSTDDQMAALNVQGLRNVTYAALLHLVRAVNDSPRGVADLVNISSTADRVAARGVAYDLTRSGVIAFSEAIRREMFGQHMRVSVVESDAVDTEVVPHVREDIRQAARRQTESMEPMRSGDIADAVAYIVIRDRRVTVNEILIRATKQT
jgi:NADP-dependent 3-hydroxy acid dehydrogenase YdfG